MILLMQRLYGMGGRKFTVAGMPPLGCLPVQMTNSKIAEAAANGTIFRLEDAFVNRVCVDQQNKDATAYNSKLVDVLKGINSSLPAARIAYVDIYNPVMDMIRNPKKYGEISACMFINLIQFDLGFLFMVHI